MLGVFGFGVRRDDSRFVVQRTRCEGDEDVAFDCCWEYPKQGVVNVFTNQTVYD